MTSFFQPQTMFKSAAAFPWKMAWLRTKFPTGVPGAAVLLEGSCPGSCVDGKDEEDEAQQAEPQDPGGSLKG